MPSLALLSIDLIYVVNMGSNFRLEFRIEGLDTLAILKPIHLAVQEINKFIYFVQSVKLVKVYVIFIGKFGNAVSILIEEFFYLGFFCQCWLFSSYHF